MRGVVSLSRSHEVFVASKFPEAEMHHRPEQSQSNSRNVTYSVGLDVLNFYS